GRLRLHLPSRTAEGVDRIEERLGRVQGVESVKANPLTGNVFIHFDPRTTGEKRSLKDLQNVLDELVAAPAPPPAPRSRTAPKDGSRQPVERRGRSTSPWIRVGMRGLLGHAVVDSVWFAAGFLGKSLGLPLGGLGPLHVLVDIAVWGMA